MIDIDKIPGFKETPNVIDNMDDAVRVLKIAGLTGSCISIVREDIEQIKKLLDNRRGLLKMALRTYDLLFDRPILKEEIFSPEVFKLIKQVTGLSWEELNEQ